MTRRILPLALLLVGLGACEDATGPETLTTLDIGFATVPSTAAYTLTPGTAAANGSFTVTGSNGTLTIDAIHLVVDKFKLEGADDACETVDDDAEDDTELDDCEEFESAPSLIEIPLDGSEVNVLTAGIPVGTYTALEWEVEDIDLDEDDEEETELEAVAAVIDSIFGTDVWPEEASMAVQGSFLHVDSTEAQDFTTFFEAEIEVETEIVPPLEITEEGASRELTILLDPEAWFATAEGEVLDLAALSGSVVEFELEFEDGIASIEYDDDEDEDEDDDD